MQENLTRLRGLLLASMLFLLFSVSSRGQNDRDFLLWNTTSLQAPVSKSYYLRVSTKTQYLPEVNSREESYLDVALYQKMSQWFQLGVGLRGAQHLKTDGTIYEYRPLLISKISFACRSIHYKTTNRLGYRVFSNQEHYMRYYHNFFIQFPSVGKLPKPYLGEEVFIKLNTEKIHMMRAHAGLNLLDQEHFKLDTFYAFQYLKSSNVWRNTNIIGLNLSFFI